MRPPSSRIRDTEEYATETRQLVPFAIIVAALVAMLWARPSRPESDIPQLSYVATAHQLTSDRSNKSQPAWSPDGKRITFTVWDYDATFHSFKSLR